ncbi:MAG: alpha/beta hydrolase [Flavobacteriia bacterium]|jgi:alpha-beta hydrolase superfamily lysophospholipase
MKKFWVKFLIGLLSLYVLFCVLIYFNQESIIFVPDKLAKKYEFSFNSEFEELNFKTKDGYNLNALHFKADTCKGLVFYLHGNAGSLKSWGDVAVVYTDLGYDVLMLDYRAYGKSSGTIFSEAQFYSDVEHVFLEFVGAKNYSKKIILGYSIGTFAATKLASRQQVDLLVLQAPYYNLEDLMAYKFSILPSFLLKYKFETNKYLPKCKMPIVIFHGKNDGLIPFSSSLKLKKLFQAKDKLIPLKGFGHNGMSENEQYLEELKQILSFYN